MSHLLLVSRPACGRTGPLCNRISSGRRAGGHCRSSRPGCRRQARIFVTGFRRLPSAPALPASPGWRQATRPRPCWRSRRNRRALAAAQGTSWQACGLTRCRREAAQPSLEEGVLRAAERGVRREPVQPVLGLGSGQAPEQHRVPLGEVACAFGACVIRARGTVAAEITGWRFARVRPGYSVQRRQIGVRERGPCVRSLQHPAQHLGERRLLLGQLAMRRWESTAAASLTTNCAASIGSSDLK